MYYTVNEIIELLKNGWGIQFLDEDKYVIYIFSDNCFETIILTQDTPVEKNKLNVSEELARNEIEQMLRRNKFKMVEKPLDILVD